MKKRDTGALDGYFFLPFFFNGRLSLRLIPSLDDLMDEHGGEKKRDRFIRLFVPLLFFVFLLKMSRLGMKKMKCIKLMDTRPYKPICVSVHLLDVDDVGGAGLARVTSACSPFV